LFRNLYNLSFLQPLFRGWYKIVSIISNEFPEGDDRILTSARMSAESYAQYLNGLSSCQKLDEKGKLISAEFEDPNQILSFHAGIVKIPDKTEFDNIDIKNFSEMLSYFDDVGIYIDSGIEFTLVKHIYTEET